VDRIRAARLSVARWTIASSIVVVCLGCVGRITPSELLGRWEMLTKNGAQVLQLSRNSKFTHEWIAEETHKTATGEWELIDISRAPAILLKYNRDFDCHSSGASLNVVRRWDGGIELSADPDRQSVFARREASGE
jgi:hypothetical protein